MARAIPPRRVPGPVLVAILATLAAAPQARQVTFSADTRTVAVYATVQAADGRLVPDMTRADFEVFEDGNPAAITQFSADPQPLSLALMLDTSVNAGNGLASFRPTDRQRTRDGVVAFLDALRAEDRVRIGSFGLQIAIGGNLTSERTELTRVLDEEIWTGGGTPLWQALVAAMQSLSSEPGRRVVLAFTNGIDTGRLPGFVGRRSNIDDFAARTNTMLYAVRLSNSVVAWDKLTDDIRQVAEASGGGHFDVPVDADLRATFVRIAEELRHQYLIGFVPSAPDGQVHQVEVRSTRPELRVRARRTFVAGGRS